MPPITSNDVTIEIPDNTLVPYEGIDLIGKGQKGWDIPLNQNFLNLASKVKNLFVSLDGKSDTSHTHDIDISDISGLNTILVNASSDANEARVLALGDHYAAFGSLSLSEPVACTILPSPNVSYLSGSMFAQSIDMGEFVKIVVSGSLTVNVSATLLNNELLSIKLSDILNSFPAHSTNSSIIFYPATSRLLSRVASASGVPSLVSLSFTKVSDSILVKTVSSLASYPRRCTLTIDPICFYIAK